MSQQDAGTKPPGQELDELREQVAALERRIEEDRTILDLLPVMFWYKDTHNLHLRVNRSAAALEGLPITAIEGKTAEELYPPEQAEAFMRDDRIVIQSGEPKLGIIEKHVSPLGKTVWLKTGKLPTRDAQGTVNGVIAFALDVTEEYELRDTTSEALTKAIDMLQHDADRDAISSLLQDALSKSKRIG
jgi:PAS domain S-box-containing protein